MEIGITNPRIRRAANGGIIIEVLGADGAAKADNLAVRIREVVGQVAHVARPYAKGEVLLIGLDDSVSREEITRAVAEVGKCTEDSIRTGPIRPMRSGLGMVWVQCPLATMNRLIEDGRLLVSSELRR